MLNASAPHNTVLGRTRTANWARLAGWGVLFWVGSLLGCASSLEYRSLAAGGDLPSRIELSETPFHAQTAHHCGPASLAMVLNATGVAVMPEDLADLTYLPAREGSLGVELLATPRQFQLLGYKVKPELDALLKEVAAGRPVLVLQNLGLSWLPRWHYAVLVGYDLDADQAILRSGTTHRQTMALSTFERTWRRGERWAMLALRPSETPAIAQELPYLQAALGLEQVGHIGAAGDAYRQATRLWPSSTAPWMAWGNNRYGAGDLVRAREAFAQVLELDSQFAPAYNNLAQVMADMGHWREAEQLVSRALELDQTYAAVYRQTLHHIQQERERAPTPAAD